MNLREVRKKIKSVKNVKKITKAMQLVSSVKMKKAQKAAIDGRAYHENLEQMIQRVSGTSDMKETIYGEKPKNAKEKELIIYVTSNKGLNGSFLTSLNRYLVKNLNYKKDDFIAVGKKGAMFIGGLHSGMVANFSSAHPVLDTGAIFSIVDEEYLKLNYSKVSIVYNKFINTIKYQTVKEQILPVKIEEIVEDDAKKKKIDPYTIEPLSTELVDALLKSYIEERIRSALLNSEASEHSARMMAMKNATDNAENVIYSLTLEGNKLRQEKITSELLDMITAKESVEGD